LFRSISIGFRWKKRFTVVGYIIVTYYVIRLIGRNIFKNIFTSLIEYNWWWCVFKIMFFCDDTGITAIEYWFFRYFLQYNVVYSFNNCLYNVKYWYYLRTSIDFSSYLPIQFIIIFSYRCLWWFTKLSEFVWLCLSIILIFDKYNIGIEIYN